MATLLDFLQSGHNFSRGGEGRIGAGEIVIEGFMVGMPREEYLEGRRSPRGVQLADAGQRSACLLFLPISVFRGFSSCPFQNPCTGGIFATSRAR